jgi:hypothetical protein
VTAAWAVVARTGRVVAAIAIASVNRWPRGADVDMVEFSRR